MLFAIIECILDIKRLNKLDDYAISTDRDIYDTAHPEYQDLLKEVLKEKEEKELRLNTIKLLNKELEEVDRIDKEINDLLKV